MDPRALGVNVRSVARRSRKLVWRSVLSALLIAVAFSTPTPLAPGLHGTVGVPNRGVLNEAEELPVRGTGFVRYRPQSTHYFGRPRLVSALQQAAADVRTPSTRRRAAVHRDLSAKSGGRIPGHDSHRTGRDVDLLFLVTTPEGVPVPSPGFVRFEGDGLARLPDSRDFVRLDVDREWLLLRSLLTSPEIGVQFMFVCHEIEALLIDHARALGEPDALIWHAETVMLEPSDSLRHDDHVHLRIACSPEEAVSAVAAAVHVGNGCRHTARRTRSTPATGSRSRTMIRSTQASPRTSRRKRPTRLAASLPVVPLGRGQLYRGDCLRVLTQLSPAQGFDLAYMDPPFNAAASAAHDKSAANAWSVRWHIATLGAGSIRSWPCSSRGWPWCAMR